MRIIRFSELQQTPWKNGGGITREIAIAHRGDKLIWRLSIADVGGNGPFSKFEGLTRILTVIEGRGMELISHDARIQADYAVPITFDGGLDIRSHLKDGPLRDFNLIYNPAFCSCAVQVVSTFSKHTVEGRSGQTLALHCIAGSAALGETEVLHKGDTTIVEGEACHFAIHEGSAVQIAIIQTAATS